MSHDIELELHTRPNDGTALSLVARRLQVCLLEFRTGHIHDHAIRGRPDASLTLAPPGALTWCANAEMVWNKVEWAERHGSPPILFEMRTPVPDSFDAVRMHEFARSVAGFVARDLSVPVTVTVIDGNAPWPMRDAEGHQVRLCFPTRMLALNDGSNAIRDRSNEPSGFAARLMMVSNPHLAKAFVQRVTQEVGRLRRHPSPNSMPRSSDAVSQTATMAIFDEMDLLTDLTGPPSPKAAPAEDPQTHPLLVRLRREAPRGMTVPDLRDFEMSMGFARTVEEALADLMAHATADAGSRDKLARITTATLDHAHLLDKARRYRAVVTRELEDLQRKKGSLMTFLRGRFEVASLAREKKAVDLRRAKEHVEELKAAIGRLRVQERRLTSECASSTLIVNAARHELHDAVKALHSTDPRLLVHLVTICEGEGRDHMRHAVANAIPQPKVPDETPTGDDGGQSGPPERPGRRATPGK